MAAPPPLADSHGRIIDYLRLSVTDRCNLRCMYCMPPGGVEWMSHGEMLRFEEILRICRVLAGLGIGTVRVTGGEPLVRRGVTGFIGELKAVAGIRRLTMTSNGLLLGEHLETLATAGLDAVNLSLDTLDGEKFRRLTGGEGPGKILPAIDLALGLGLDVKVNCVPMLGFNEDDIVKLAALTRDRRIAVRFIELMPLGIAATLMPLPIAEAFALVERAFGPLTPSPAKLGSGPAAYHTLPGFAGHVGFIGALSHGFCGNCNRLRLTASGLLKSCLAGGESVDLRRLVRGGAGDGEIAGAVLDLVGRKPAGHGFGTGGEGREHRKREMFRIGG